MDRPLTIIANWKMHKTRLQAQEFMQSLQKCLVCDHLNVLIAAPYTVIETCIALGIPGVKVGAQNVSEHRSGPYTGEISAEMLADVKASFCLVGHSERRILFHETSEQIAKKILRLVEAGIQPILCVGETFEQRQAGLTEQVLFSQIETALCSLSLQDIGKICLSYEPVWAIGSGVAASAEILQLVHGSCRDFLRKRWGQDISDQVKILYGGSVTSHTIAQIISQNDVDGVLIGGASLDVHMFANIIKISGELKL